LPFKCTGCGKCCTGGPGYIWVSDDEILSIAGYLKMSVEQFYRKYLRRVGDRISLKEKGVKNFDCIFLNGTKCQIYPVRPKQCKTFPFWPSLLRSEEGWKEAAERCEGIYPDAPLVPLETIEENRSQHLEDPEDL
jgi:Fe-S-cluster containining protein